MIHQKQNINISLFCLTHHESVVAPYATGYIVSLLRLEFVTFRALHGNVFVYAETCDNVG